VSDVFPSLAKARELRLLPTAAEPVEERMLAALVVDVDVVFRQSWSEVKCVDREDFVRLPQAVPEHLVAQGVHHVVGEIIQDTPTWVRCRVDHHTDQPIRWIDCFVSKDFHGERLAGLEAVLDSLVQSQRLPDALRIHDLTPQTHGGPYREAATARVRADFQGWDFSGALPAVVAEVERLGRRGSACGGEIRIHAWPLLMLRFEELERREYALFFDPAGALHLFSGRPR
jgi:hypothetical protein